MRLLENFLGKQKVDSALIWDIEGGNGLGYPFFALFAARYSLHWRGKWGGREGDLSIKKWTTNVSFPLPLPLPSCFLPQGFMNEELRVERDGCAHRP